MKIERRFLRELRAESQGDEAVLVGYASVFGSQSEDLGGFRETVMPGAFTRSIREGADVKFLMNHDPSLVMGRTKNKTLSLEEDARGLKFRVVLPNTQSARDLHALVTRGDMDQCSFAFTVREQSWEDIRDGNGDLYANRKLMDVDLMDVSAVTYPAYTDTQVSARALFPEGEPVEVRSALDTIKEKRGSEAQPPKPYAINLPQPFDSDMKQEWWDAFMSEYKDVMGKKHNGGKWISNQEAISMATAAANLKVQPATEVPPEVKGQGGPNRTPSPWEEVITDGRALTRALELRYTEGTFEDRIEDINRALTDKLGYSKNGVGWGRYYVVETYPEHVIVRDNDENCYYDITYTYDEAGDPEVTLGDLVKVDQEYVPTARMLRIAEKRIYSSTTDVPDYVPADKKAQWKEVWNSAYKKAKEDGKNADDAEASAFAQANGVAGPESKAKDGMDGETEDDKTKTKKRNAESVSDPDSPDYDPDDPDYDPSLDETDGEGRAAKTPADEMILQGLHDRLRLIQIDLE